MPEFTVKRTEWHQVARECSETFDTTSQEQWDSLRDRVEPYMESSDFALLPSNAPLDPEIWLSAYRKIDPTELDGDTYDDWVSDRKGGYEVVWTVEDESGGVVIEEDD